MDRRRGDKGVDAAFFGMFDGFAAAIDVGMEIARASTQYRSKKLRGNDVPRHVARKPFVKLHNFCSAFMLKKLR